MRTHHRWNNSELECRRYPMPITDRSSLLLGVAALPLLATGATQVMAQGADKGTDPAPTSPSAKPAAAKDVTRKLAHYVVSAGYDDLPANVRKEGVRTLLNWVGVAIGGSHHQTVDIAVSALAPFSGPQQASLYGRRERFDIMNAAFINGVSSLIFDYDATHLKTIF